MLTYYLDRRDHRRDRRREGLAGAECLRREERAEGERRRYETMTGTITALTAILERNGHTPADQSAAIERLQRRITEVEAEIAFLRDGNSGGSSHGHNSE